MISLIKNECYKLKREFFLLFLLLLTLLPVITGVAGAMFHDSTKDVGDLFFFMNNQFTLFFPVVLFILVGSLFYQEYKNKTYINWITYGYSKPKLFLSKVIVSMMIGIVFALIFLLLFLILMICLQSTGKVSVSDTSLLSIAIGFLLESLILILVTSCAGAIIINLGRNIIVSSVIGVIYGFVSAFFIGSDIGYRIPGGFAYRIAMYFVDHSTYYEDASKATFGGIVSVVLVFVLLLTIGLFLFSKKRKIES